jgi:hypothetical protein
VLDPGADGDEFVIDGAKMWLTNGGTSTLTAVLVRTDEGGQRAHQNRTCILVEKPVGYGEVAPACAKMCCAVHCRRARGCASSSSRSGSRSANQSVREALARLAEQGLVVALPQQGFRVRPLTLTDLDELTDARVEIETMVLRRSNERGDIAWESSVVAGHHQLAHTPITRPSEDLNAAWFTAHEEFHRSTLRGCGNDRL